MLFMQSMSSGMSSLPPYFGWLLGLVFKKKENSMRWGSRLTPPLPVLVMVIPECLLSLGDEAPSLLSFDLWERGLVLWMGFLLCGGGEAWFLLKCCAYRKSLWGNWSAPWTYLCSPISWQELIFSMEGFKPYGWYLTLVQFAFYSIFGLIELQLIQDKRRRYVVCFIFWA